MQTRTSKLVINAHMICLNLENTTQIMVLIKAKFANLKLTFLFHSKFHDYPSISSVQERNTHVFICKNGRAFPKIFAERVKMLLLEMLSNQKK